jgi:hypothetical protein
MENATLLASTSEDSEGLARKIALLEDELAVELRAQEVSEREHREQFQELTLLQTRGSELCHAIIGPPRARHHLTKGMRLEALYHSKMAGDLAMLWAMVSTTVESLGCSPSDTFHVKAVSELTGEFQKIKDWRSRLEQPATRICDLLLGSPPNRVRWANHMDEAVGQLSVELAARREADAELEALQTSVV